MFNNPSPKKEENNIITFQYPIIETIELSRPLISPPINFWDAVITRRSTTQFNDLSLEELSNVLWLSAKVKEISVQENGYILTHRPSASGGARHPIDIIVLSPALDSSNSFYYYNPFMHTLNKLCAKSDSIEQLKNQVSSIFDLKKSTLLWFVAHPDRTAAKYDNPLSLIWRDAGALIHCIQIACAGYKIGSCAIGILGEPFISAMFIEQGNVIGAGGLIIG